MLLLFYAPKFLRRVENHRDFSGRRYAQRKAAENEIIACFVVDHCIENGFKRSKFRCTMVAAGSCIVKNCVREIGASTSIA
jgi:hypothetical protein